MTSDELKLTMVGYVVLMVLTLALAAGCASPRRDSMSFEEADRCLQDMPQVLPDRTTNQR